ncbi:MAG TPA: iron-containing alcohol dehydrogenase [Acidobacteriota bacterium]
MIRCNSEQTFNFFPVPTDIHFGYGILATLPERIRSLGGQRVFLVTDAGIRTAGILQKALELLSSARIGCEVYDGVKQDSGSKLIAEAAELLRRCKADVVVGIGGGSSLDTAKAVATLLTNPGTILDYTGLHKVKNRLPPVIAIPTTAGTGSEVSLWSVFTNDDTGLKVAVGSISAYPMIAMCDPELTLDLPPLMTAATGMDALAHGIECYTNNACQPISAALAWNAIQLIGRHLRPAVLNGPNRDSRYAMLLASTMAGIAMNPTRLGLAHALAMPLGSWDLRIPHGIAIAVTLPRVMRFNCVAAPERFAAIAHALAQPVGNLPAADAAQCAVAAVEKLANDIQIPKGLREYGLRSSHIPRVVDEAMKSGNVAVNPRSTSNEQLRAVLEQSL